jgi:hypothetical protein
MMLTYRTAAEINFNLQVRGRKGFHHTPNIISAHTPGRTCGLPALCHWPWFEIHFTLRDFRLLPRCNLGILLSITNKMQRYTIFFINVNALHVSSGFSAHHQELKTVHTASGICQACLLLLLAVAASKHT